MSNIKKIEDNLIPKDAVACKNGMKTKKIYLKNDTNEFFVFYNNFSVENGSILIASNETESIKTRKEYSDKIGEWVYVDLFNADTRIAYERVGDIVRSNSYPNGSYLVEFNSSITIAFDLNRYFYCIPELPPPEIIPVDKATSTTSLNDITNYINKTTESIKSCKSYIAYVINNKGGSATDTETLESLINKLNNTLNTSPDNPMPEIEIMQPSKLKLGARFNAIYYKLQEINDLLKESSDILKTIMDANNLMYEPTDNFSTLVQKLNNEPINFLLEGTKIRSIFGKYLSIYPSAPPVGVEYYHLEFTNIKNDSWIDLKEDLSLKQDGSISLYKESINDGRNDQTTYYIYSENKIYANIDSSYMFNLGLSMIYSINFKNLCVDYVENASHLFEDISGNNGDCPLCKMINFLNLRFKNIKNISYMFNHYDLAGENHFRVESNNIIDYSNFCENHDWNNGYNYLILDYINDKTKKIAETIVSESKNNVKLGTLVTQ